MKLSEMTNKQAFKAIAQIMPVAKEIVKDKTLLDIWFRKLELTLGATEQDHKKEKAVYAIDKIGDLIPYLLEHHEKNIFKILAILNDKKVTEIANQNFMETLGQLTEALNDEALQKLFIL